MVPERCRDHTLQPRAMATSTVSCNVPILWGHMSKLHRACIGGGQDLYQVDALYRYSTGKGWREPGGEKASGKVHMEALHAPHDPWSPVLRAETLRAQRWSKINGDINRNHRGWSGCGWGTPWQGGQLGATTGPKSAISIILTNLEAASPCCAFQKSQGTLSPSVPLWLLLHFFFINSNRWPNMYDRGKGEDVALTTSIKTVPQTLPT